MADTKKIMIAGAVLLALVGTAVWVVRDRSAETVTDETAMVTLPTVVVDTVDELEIKRPEDKEPVKLKKAGGTWQLTAPVQATADQPAVQSALDALGELEAAGQPAATKGEHHALLEVSADKAVHVIAKANGKPQADLYFGAYRGGSTMVREEGEVEVAATKGSLRHRFSKELKMWRDRKIATAKADQVQRVVFESAKGTFVFDKDANGTWKPAADQKAIERFEANKVGSVVSSLVSMNATDFAAPGIDAQKAGLDEPSAVARLWVAAAPARKDDPAAADSAGGKATNEQVKTEELVFQLGAERDGKAEFYLQRVGNGTIYVVSKFLADRVGPEQSAFQAEPPTDDEPEDSAPTNAAQISPSAPLH